MLQEALDILPDAIQRMPIALAIGLAAAGVVLAIVGARLSRSILTLVLVAGGTILGLHLPKWFGWGIDSMGTAFGVAIILGLSGFMLSKMWEGLLLGTLLAMAAGAVVWVSLAPGIHWELPQIDWTATYAEIALKVWASLPATVNRALPTAILLGAGIGWFFVMLWPRLGRVLLYSLAGSGLYVVFGSIGLRQSRPDLYHLIATDVRRQGEILGAFVLFSGVLQWLLLPRAGKKPPPRTSDKPVNEVPVKPVAEPQKPTPEIAPVASAPKILPPPIPAWAKSNANQVKGGQ